MTTREGVLKFDWPEKIGAIVSLIVLLGSIISLAVRAGGLLEQQQYQGTEIATLSTKVDALTSNVDMISGQLGFKNTSFVTVKK